MSKSNGNNGLCDIAMLFTHTSTLLCTRKKKFIYLIIISDERNPSSSQKGVVIWRKQKVKDAIRSKVVLVHLAFSTLGEPYNATISAIFMSYHIKEKMAT